MAIEVITWVLKHSRSRNGARLVLIAIADSTNEHGTCAWPSVKTLAAKANLSERSVQGALKELVKLGELKVEWNQGPYGSNWYTVLMRQAPAESAPPQNVRPADSAGMDTGTESDTIPQDPPQNLRPAESAPPQNSTETPAESAPKPSMNRPTKKTSPSSGTRGTRIPDDFAMTPEMIAWGQENYPQLDGQAITAEFVDYWRGVPGAKGVKIDWIATWRNQVRRVAERQAAGQRASPGLRPSAMQQRIDEGLERAERMRLLDEAEARGEHIPGFFSALPPGTLGGLT